MDNTSVWFEVYDSTDFGNKYPFSYLVTLFHRRIKPELVKNKNLKDLKILDFGCSYGANSRVFKDLNCEVFGVDISPKIIDKCIEFGLGDCNHFKCENLLNYSSLDEVFEGVKFDFILASECMYYFTNSEQDKLINMFYNSLSENGIVYASYPTFDTLIYRDYADCNKDENGMIEILQSGSIEHNISVNLPYNKKRING